MARASQLDPLDSFRFIVEIEGFTRGGFVNCSVPSYEISTRKYKEGGRHLNPLVIVDSISYKPVILSRGVTTDTSFNKWACQFIDFVQNNSTINSAELGKEAVGFLTNGFTSPIPSNKGDPSTFSYRRNVKIFNLDRTGAVQVAYYLYNAFPTEYTPASDFNSSSETISIENLSLGYEGFEVRYAGIIGTLGSLAGQALSALSK